MLSSLQYGWSAASRRRPEPRADNPDISPPGERVRRGCSPPQRVTGTLLYAVLLKKEDESGWRSCHPVAWTSLVEGSFPQNNEPAVLVCQQGLPGSTPILRPIRVWCREGEYPPSRRMGEDSGMSGRTWIVTGSLILPAVHGASLLSCSLQEVLLCGEGENQ